MTTNAAVVPREIGLVRGLISSRRPPVPEAKKRRFGTLFTNNRTGLVAHHLNCPDLSQRDHFVATGAEVPHSGSKRKGVCPRTTPKPKQTLDVH